MAVSLSHTTTRTRGQPDDSQKKMVVLAFWNTHTHYENPSTLQDVALLARERNQECRLRVGFSMSRLFWRARGEWPSNYEYTRHSDGAEKNVTENCLSGHWMMMLMMITNRNDQSNLWANSAILRTGETLNDFGERVIDMDACVAELPDKISIDSEFSHELTSTPDEITVLQKRGDVSRLVEPMEAS